jgi:hypothetical protein
MYCHFKEKEDSVRGWKGERRRKRKRRRRRRMEMIVGGIFC